MMNAAAREETHIENPVLEIVNEDPVVENVAPQEYQCLLQSTRFIKRIENTLKRLNFGMITSRKTTGVESQGLNNFTIGKNHKSYLRRKIRLVYVTNI